MHTEKRDQKQQCAQKRKRLDPISRLSAERCRGGQNSPLVQMEEHLLHRWLRTSYLVRGGVQARSGAFTSALSQGEARLEFRRLPQSSSKVLQKSSNNSCVFRSRHRKIYI
eukprot:scaffold3854_cov251-Pinguiococcus_pyrenoidosus.AAC.17